MSKYRTKQIADLAQVFAALSNTNRLQLLLRLIDYCGPGVSCQSDAEVRACVSEISKGMNLAASTVSHHLKELKQAGLIQVRRNGQKMDCSIDAGAIERLLSFFEEITTNDRVRTSARG